MPRHRWCQRRRLTRLHRGRPALLLPRPLRGDFPAFGTVYRALAADQEAEALSIAWERDRALEWLTGLGSSWDDIPSES